MASCVLVKKTLCVLVKMTPHDLVKKTPCFLVKKTPHVKMTPCVLASVKSIFKALLFRGCWESVDIMEIKERIESSSYEEDSYKSHLQGLPPA